MTLSILNPVHILSVVIWVGGMFFAYMALRPAAISTLEPPLRLQLWRQTFKHFFPWVWAAIITLLVTGFWMMFDALQKIKEGTYGICEGCGEDIPEERLCAIPWTRFCAKCAQEYEQMYGSYMESSGFENYSDLRFNREDITEE